MIRKYEKNDFQEVNFITLSKWKEEKMINEHLCTFLHSLLTKYCYLNPNLSFVNITNKIDAFAFASYKDDKPNCCDWIIKNTSKMSEKDKIEVMNYYEYLNYNHHKVIHYMKEKDIYVSLFASNKKGRGKELIELLENIAKKDKAHIFLWTDETCSYEYYQKNNFILVEEYFITFQGKKIRTFIYKK